MSFTLKWGILATGKIAEVFTKDLLADPRCRDTIDVAHQVVAVASSTSPDRAREFITKVGAPSSVKAYGSYAELVMDPEVQIIYVATPHSHHFQNVMLALDAGKHVLCEKAITVTAQQTEILIMAARQKGLFLMEAVWTRFLPVSSQIQTLVENGSVGVITRVIADMSYDSTIAGTPGTLYWDDSHRAVNKDLGGGALLDIGVYALTWIFLILYRLQPEMDKEAPLIASAVNQYDRTGVDDHGAIILHFPRHKTMGIAMTGLRTETGVIEGKPKAPSVQIQGTLGEIQIFGPAFKPSSYKMILRNGYRESMECSVPEDPERGNWGHGMFWEADECARCLRDGLLESDRMPLSESLAVMRVVDEVLGQGGVIFPDSITSCQYDSRSAQNLGRG